MDAEDSAKLDFAKKLVEYLGSNNLPKELIDDKRLRVDWQARTDDELLLAHYKEDSLFGIKTVRFLKDFHLYKAAPDLKTTNQSFLRTAEVFRRQGIKNYYFHLQLNNPLLQGVDPHDIENLSNEQISMIMHETSTNFWYFLREICRLGPNYPFLANRGNISFIWSYLNHITTYMIMPRQQGKTQPNSTKVRVIPNKEKHVTPADCWKRLGDLQPGETIVDRFGKPAKVIGVHPQGQKRVYRITTSDGRKTEAGAEHLWTVKDSTQKLNGKALWGDYSTADMITLLKDGATLQLPLIDPQDGPQQHHVIDPYVMGLIVLGKNTHGMFDLTVSDEQLQYVEGHCPGGMKTLKMGAGYFLFREDNLPLSFDKNVGVPQTYLEGSLEDRIKLLHAFLDSKGVVGEGSVYFPCKGVLSNQVQYLVRSLGGTAKKAKNGVSITLPKTVAYFSHQPTVRPVKEVNALFVKDIKFVWDDECTCIEVDAMEHLYITDDFLVTHNTVAVQVINFWLTYIMGRGYTSHLITLKSDNRAQFIAAIKTIRNSIPKYLINSTYKDKDAGTSLTYKAFGEDKVNTLYINVPQQGEEAAGDLGRGLRVGTTKYDESAYIKFIDVIIDGCAPSALTEMAKMRAAGLPHGISHITTPNTTLHASGDFMFKKLMSATEWREKFFDSLSESHLKARLIKASPTETTSPTVSMVYNYLQLGKDKSWVKEVIDQLSLSLAKAKIDLLLMWVEDGENRLFDDVTREAINNVKREIVWSKEYRDSNLYMDFFVSQAELMEMSKKEHNDFFLIGCDTSSAINKDACTIIIRSMRTGKVVGVGRYPLTFLDDVTAILVDLLDVIKNSLLIIERNYAHHMIDSLLIMLPAKGMDPFTRIYNSIYQDTVHHQKDYEEVRRTTFSNRSKHFYLKFKQHFGFLTTKTSRETLYGLVMEAVGNTGYGLHYGKLADELINLRTKADRIDHDSKMHDDLVIAWLLSYWFIKLGQNKSLYGIPPGIALTDIRNLMNESKGGGPELEPHVASMLAKIKEKVAKLTDELMSTDDNLLALRLEAEIRKLVKLLPAEHTRLMTIDNLVEDAKVERNKRLMKQRRAA